MNRTSTLIVGIGGIGSRIASEISQLIEDRDRSHVGFVCIDADHHDLTHVKKENVKKILLYTERPLLRVLMDNPKCKEWFPYYKRLLHRSLPEIYAQDRFVSRLFAIGAEQEGKYHILKEEIARLCFNQEDGKIRNLTVMIVGTLTGGVGAGIFLQLPLYIRNVIKDLPQIETGKTLIRGLFFGADITSGLMPSMQNVIKGRANAYACLKELNTCYLSDPESGQEKTAIPYDYLYLMEAGNNDGIVGYKSLQKIIDMAAHMVFSLMVTPRQENAFSVEDNDAIRAIGQNWTNRFAGIGLCRLIYPVDQVREYVTLRSICDLIQNRWQLIDRRFELLVKQEGKARYTDATVEIPKLEQSYLELFWDEVKPGSGGTLGYLYQEAFIENPEDHTFILRTAKYAAHIVEQINKMLEDSDKIMFAQKDCDLEITRMTNPYEAEDEVVRAMTGLEYYESIAKNFVARSRFLVANRMVPPSIDVLMMKKKDGISIYSLLSGAHPVTARFLIYSLIDQLKSIKSDIEPKITLDYGEKDYDLKKEGIQTPEQALENLASRKFLFKKKLLELSLRLRNDFKEHKDIITEYIKNSLVAATCDILISRLHTLAEHYDLFFQSISLWIKDNEKRVHDIENMLNVNPVGQLCVYCSRDPLRNIYEEFREQGVRDIEEASKIEIFTQLYKMFSFEYENMGWEHSQEQKERILRDKESKMSAIFEHTVADIIRNNVRNQGTDTMNMDIREALAKQYNLETGINATDQLDYEANLDQYIKKIVERAMLRATPLLAVDGSANRKKTKTVYLALNPSCAGMAGNVPDANATKKAYINPESDFLDGCEPTVLIDEGIGKYEIICFKTTYLYPFESLTHYKKDSRNESAYREQMHKLNHQE